MPTEAQKVPVNEARQELRQLAHDLKFELQQLSRRLDDVRARLFIEARAIRQEHRAKRTRRISRDPITVSHGPEGRSTRKGHGEADR